MTSGPNRAVIRDYLAVQASFFMSQGLLMVMLPYLVTHELGLGSEYLGNAQAAISLPMLLLMLPGGAIADRFDSRSIITVVHTLAAIAPIVMGVVLFAGTFSYFGLILFGFTFGVLGAFGQPARDSLLNRVVLSSNGAMGLQRAVTLATLVMFASQIVGMVLASQADRFGASVMLIIQGIILLISVVLARLLVLAPYAPPDHPPGIAFQFRQMADGLAEAFSHKQIMPVVTVAFFIGIFYMGSFQVILPLQVRDLHDGGSKELAITFICFFGGTIVSSMAILRRGGIERAGLAIFCAVSAGVVILGTLSLPLPFWLMLIAVFLWGMGAGVTITLSRGIVQEMSPDSHRGRLLAVFSMGFMGGAPIGNVAMGYLIKLHYFDALSAALVPAVMMACALGTLALTSELLRVRLPRHHR